jgi:transcriptional regulator with XRE-family HTH domain
MTGNEYEERFRNVGFRIAYYRKMRGYTQETFAEKLNVGASYYSQIEAAGCYKPISLKTLFRIADALEVDPHKLLQFE